MALLSLLISPSDEEHGRSVGGRTTDDTDSDTNRRRFDRLRVVDAVPNWGAIVPVAVLARRRRPEA